MSNLKNDGDQVGLNGSHWRGGSLWEGGLIWFLLHQLQIVEGLIIEFSALYNAVAFSIVVFLVASNVLCLSRAVDPSFFTSALVLVPLNTVLLPPLLWKELFMLLQISFAVCTGILLWTSSTCLILTILYEGAYLLLLA